MSHSL